MNAVEDWLAAVEARDLTICGSCDGGLPMACTCGDPRASLALTVAALRAVLGEADPGNLIVAASAAWVAGYQDAMSDVRVRAAAVLDVTL